MTDILELKNVSKKFGDKEILNDINFKLTQNKIVGLLGQNGSGKTTIFKLINDLLTPTTGKILVCGKPIGIESKKQISYLPERTYFDKYTSVEEALKFFETFYDNFDRPKAERLLKDLGLDKTQSMEKMSKGMKEKVQLVLVMSRKAKLYILDEPLGGVDPATRDYILDTILNNFEENATLFISTHMIADIERILDEVIILDGGKIIVHENADKLREKENKSIDEIFRSKVYGKKSY